MTKKPFFGDGYTFEYGKMDTIRGGRDGAIIAYGGMVVKAVKISEELAEKGITLKVINMSCVHEIDNDVMKETLAQPHIFTYEDHNVFTGIAPVVTGYLLKNGYRGKFESFGVKHYGASGDTEEVYAIERLDVESMVKALLEIMK
jgi:transketolase